MGWKNDYDVGDWRFGRVLVSKRKDLELQWMWDECIVWYIDNTACRECQGDNRNVKIEELEFNTTANELGSSSLLEPNCLSLYIDQR